MSNQRSSQQIEFASTVAAGTGGWAGEPSNAPITLVVGQIAPRVVTPRDMPTTTERLRARWARTGEGPALEARLRAAEAELARRERARVERSRARDAPDSDATTRRAGSPSSRAVDHAPPTPTRDVVEDALAAARDATRRDARRASALGDPPPRDARASDSDDDEVRAIEAGCVEVRPPTRPTLPPDHLDPADPIVRLKNDANDALRRGEHDLALALCDQALDALRRREHERDERDESTESTESTASTASISVVPSSSSSSSSSLRAVLLSNRARVKLTLDHPDFRGAAEDASAATKIRPEWPKPYRALADAHASLGSWALAVAACRAGAAAASAAGDHSRPFDNLLDDVAMRAAREGSAAGFYGRTVYVRSAGEEAWLGREAPENPAFDGDRRAPNDRESNLGVGLSGAHDADDADARPDGSAPPLHARSLAHAMEMVRDGDRVLLLRGVHNGLGVTADVRHRILIRGEGALREATLDARSNSPAFRILRSCVIQNVEIDFTGFCEAIRVEGDARVTPLVERCAVTCSGDDGVVVAGGAAPTFRDCAIDARKSGVRTADRSAPEFVDCRLDSSTRTGLRAHDASAPTLRNCHVENNQHEGVVAMDDANVALVECVIVDNRGPGIDVSDRARVVAERCRVRDNVGGVWLWDDAACDVRGGIVQGGSSHAVLCDERTAPAFSDGARVEGVADTTEDARPLVAPGVDGTATIEHPETPTALPPETGCFKFEHDVFDRKQ